MKRVRLRQPKVRIVPQWESQLRLIQKMRARGGTPVDSMGTHAAADPAVPKKTSDFYVLVASLLSSQSKDTVVFPALERLKQYGLDIDTIIDTKVQVLAQLIKPVGFYNRKAANLKMICKILRSKHNDTIPNTVEGLMKLPGIGPKMAYLIMNTVTNEIHGICVDTHVHRISNRLGWVKTRTPEETRKELESWLPRQYWHDTNKLIVGFGQSICKARGPRCEGCSLRRSCKAYQNQRVHP